MVGGSLTLYALRAPTVSSRVSFGWVSRESLLLFNNVVFLVATLTVLFGTLFPLFVDALGQEGMSQPEAMILPGRRFFQPIAKAVAEQRRDLLWSRDNGRRVMMILRAIAYAPEDFFPNETVYLRLDFTLKRMNEMLANGRMTDEDVAESCVFLCSDAAAQITGTTISVDGGWTAL